MAISMKDIRISLDCGYSGTDAKSVIEHILDCESCRKQQHGIFVKYSDRCRHDWKIIGWVNLPVPRTTSLEVSCGTCGSRIHQTADAT